MVTSNSLPGEKYNPNKKKIKVGLSHNPFDTIKELKSYPKCRSVKVINNPARLGSNHREVNYIYINKE